MNAFNATADVALHDLSQRTTSLRRRAFHAPLVKGALVWLVPKLGRAYLRWVTKSVTRLHIETLEVRPLIESLVQSEHVVDEDFAFIDRLERIKNNALAIRRNALKIVADSASHARLEPLGKQANCLVKVITEFYETLCEIQEAVMEHDADYSARVNVPPASTGDELEALLSRLADAG